MIAYISSLTFLPTPEKTILLAGIPAFKALLSSPIETTSAPEPNAEKVLMIDWFELAFKEKHISESSSLRALVSSLYLVSRILEE